MNTNRVGWSLLYDGHVEPEKASLLNDQEFVGKFLVDLGVHIGMKVLVEPTIRATPLDKGKLWAPEDEGGVTGFSMLTTGHVSIHTYPIRERFSLDLFSCQTFDKQASEEFIKGRFHVSNRWSHWIDRIWSRGEFNPATQPLVTLGKQDPT